MLEQLGEVYGNDARAREADMTPEERLRFRQEHSQPIMDTLHGWLGAQFAERRVKPNSSLGKAITYLLRHWKALTLFLRQAGVSVGNNLCERAVKRAVLYRKDALFYRTLNGAQVGTCSWVSFTPASCAAPTRSTTWSSCSGMPGN